MTDKQYLEFLLGQEVSNSELERAFAKFPLWMNRPTSRAWVYTFKTFLNFHAAGKFNDEAMCNFRIRRLYRTPSVIQARKFVAAHIRTIRKEYKILLPIFREETGEYSPAFLSKREIACN